MLLLSFGVAVAPGNVKLCSTESGWAAPAAASKADKKKKKGGKGDAGDAAQQQQQDQQQNGAAKELDPEKAAKKVRDCTLSSRCRCICC